jgi:addiction module RelB/DinJ family antitoxin
MSLQTQSFDVLFSQYLIGGTVMNSTLTIRVDEHLKREFTDIVTTLGLDPPTVVRMLIQQTVNQKGVPLSLSLLQNTTNTTMDFIDEVRADWGEW